MSRSWRPRVPALERRIPPAGHRRSHQLAQGAQIEHPVDLDQVLLPHGARIGAPLEAELPEEPLAQRRRHGALHLHPDDRVQRAPTDRLLDRLEQIARVLVGEVQLRRPGQPEEPGALDLSLGIHQVEIRPDHVLERDQVVRIRNRKQSRDPLGESEIREVRPRPGVLEDHGQERDEVRHDRHGKAGTDGDRARREQREDLALELILQQRTAGGREVPPAAQADARLRQLRETLGEGAMLSREQRADANADRLEQPIVLIALLRLQRPDVHHVELVEIRAHDGQEVEPFQQRGGGIFRQRHHPALEFERAEIRVEQQVGLVGTHRRRRLGTRGPDPHRRLAGAEEIRSGGDRERGQRVRVVEPSGARALPDLRDVEPFDVFRRRAVQSEPPGDPHLLQPPCRTPSARGPQ